MTLHIEFGIDPDKLETIIFIKRGEVFLKSDAVFEIIRVVDWNAWSLAVLRIFPRSLRNFIYDIVAKNRYRIMKPKESCRVPSTEEKDLFI